MSELLAKRRLKNLLLFIPNMFVLCVRLLADSRVPTTERALVAGAIVYALVPLDLIPDMLPFVGQIDDAYLIALSLLRLMERTDPKIVREHWKGGGDIVELIGTAAMMAAKFLPKPIRRVLTSRVEATGGLAKPLLVAPPEPEQQITEPSADRGPQRGSPAGVVDAPDAK